MSMKLNIEQQQQVLDNENLVRYIVHNLGVTPNYTDYEDLVSIGTIGLIKAVITFDVSKNNTLATYALKCIKNEILMYYRKANKYANNISLEAPIGNDAEGTELTLADKIEHPESNFVEKFIDTETFIKLFSIILNYLKPRERIIILYRMANITQKDIGKMFNVTRGYINKVEREAILKIQEVFEQRICYKEVFSISIIGNFYKITFYSKYISNFNNKIFIQSLQNLKLDEILSNFSITSNTEQIIIKLLACSSSFYFIAQIIQEIDNFILILIEEYILSRDSFTNKELREHFPNLTSVTIHNAIASFRSKNLITAITRSKYKVNKI